jgi:hypothetical protein
VILLNWLELSKFPASGRRSANVGLFQC